MSKYFEEAIEVFPEYVNKAVSTPAAQYQYRVNENGTLLYEKRKPVLHRIVAKLLFGATGGIPDVQVPVSFLTSRIATRDEDYWEKFKNIAI